MAYSWVDITNAQVAAGAALTTALATAWRDNVGGMGQRASGAPKIYGTPYNYQEFTANGTWTKPSNAETGDIVVIHIVGGGGGGDRGSTGGGGAGGAGYMGRFDIDDLGDTEAVVVGAGGAGTSGNGTTGGTSSFGTETLAASGEQAFYLEAVGGDGATSSPNGGAHTDTPIYFGHTSYGVADYTELKGIAYADGGDAGAVDVSGGGFCIWGGGGGGGSTVGVGYPSTGGLSQYAGRGGQGTMNTGSVNDAEIDGYWPGGGGGGVDNDISDDTVGGSGADGVVRVWCIKEG